MCPCSCLYGVPLVYARGRTYITLTGLYVIVWCTVCLFGVPFTFCHGRTRIDGSSSCLYAVPLVYARIVLTLPGFIVIVWCTVLMDFSRVCMVYRVCVRSLSCLYGVPLMFFSLRSPIAGSFSSLYDVLCACCHGLRCTARPSVGLLQLPPLNYSVFYIYLQ